MKRKIAAILAADAAEYSRLVAEDEDASLSQLVASVGVFKASVKAHGGRIFNTAGDAVLAEFQSAVEAVRSAIDIQQTLRARNEACAPGKRMMFRMGISIGDVVENDGDLLGDGVNIAARLQSLSQPGGLAISKWVQEQVAGKVTVEFRDTGYQRVKNMPAPIHVFQYSVASAVPADSDAHRTTPLGISAREWPFRSLTVGFAALVVAVVLFALTRHDPAAVATGEITPIAAKQEDPAPLPAAAEQSPAQPTFVPQQTFENAPPNPSAFVKTEPVSAEPPAPPSSTPPPPADLLPAGGNSPVAPALKGPIEAALPTAPAASAPENNPAGAIQPDRSPVSLAPHPAPAEEPAADRKRQKVQCALVLERAQLGDLTSDDRAFLRSKCR